MNFPPDRKNSNTVWNIFAKTDRNSGIPYICAKRQAIILPTEIWGPVQRWNPALGNVFALGKILLAHLSVLFLLSGVHVCAVTDRNDPQPSQYYQRSGTTCNVDDLSVGIYRYRCFFNVLGSQWKTDVQSDARNPAGKCSEYRVFLEKLITKTSKIIIDHYNAHVVHCIRYYFIVYRREVGTCAKN